LLGYVTIGSGDLAVSKPFYDAILGILGGKLSLVAPHAITYTRGDDLMLSISLPYDRQPCSVGNGTMFGLSAPSPAIVDQLYATAIALGAKDEGAPGHRTPEMYIAYFRDPFGNKLAAYHIPSVPDYIQGAIEIVRARGQERGS
jgi:hypothetical protein